MGQGPSADFAKSTFALDQYRMEQVGKMHVVGLAFDKCVVRPDAETGAPSRGLDATFDSHSLAKDEKACVEEYALLYKQFLQSAGPQIHREYEQMGREMMEKARQEQMKGGR